MWSNVVDVAVPGQGYKSMKWREICGALKQAIETRRQRLSTRYRLLRPDRPTPTEAARRSDAAVCQECAEACVGVVACAWCKKKFCASCRSFSFVGYAYSTPGDFICYKCHPHDCSPPCRPKRSRSTFHGPIPKALRDFNGAGAKDDTAASKVALTRKRERAPTRRFAEYLIADH